MLNILFFLVLLKVRGALRRRSLVLLEVGSAARNCFKAVVFRCILSKSLRARFVWQRSIVAQMQMKSRFRLFCQERRATQTERNRLVKHPKPRPKIYRFVSPSKWNRYKAVCCTPRSQHSSKGQCHVGFAPFPPAKFEARIALAKKCSWAGRPQKRDF